MSISVHQYPIQRQLDLLRALVSYSFANLHSTGRFAREHLEKKRAIAFRANEITGSVNAALVSEQLSANESFPLLIATQLHSLRDAVAHSLTKHDADLVEMTLSEIGWKDIASKAQYAEMKIPVRNLLVFLTEKRNLPGHVVYAIFVEYAISIWGTSTIDAVQRSEILREIRFAPEHQQAGIAILSYFSVILRQKVPNVIASVSIRQENDKVMLIISYPDGTEEEVSQTLSDYGLVVSGQLLPEKFLTDPLQVMALKHKLEIAGMELRQARELQAFERATIDSRFQSLQSEIAYLREQLARQLELGAGVQQQLFEIATASLPSSSIQAIEPVLTKLLDAVVKRDEDSLREQVEVIRAEDPNLLDRFSEFIWSSSIAGVIGNATYDWLKVVWPILPK